MNPRTTNIGAYIQLLFCIIAQSASAGAINGPSIDRTGFFSCVLHGVAGAATGSPSAQSVIYKLQHSDDESTWEDFGDAADALTADNGQVELDVDLSGAKRYVRCVATVALTGGSSPTLPVAGTLALGGADRLPA